MDEYTPIYCASCAQLRWREHVQGDCEFCGKRVFAPIRPVPTFTAHDVRVLKPMQIPTKERK